MPFPIFQDLSFDAWAAKARELGFGTGQTRNFFRAVHRGGWVTTWDAVAVPPKQRELARSHFDLVGLPEVIARTDSSDGTAKFLLRLADGNAVEAVYIPEETRGTVCISSQVGCAMNCSFCYTAKMGLVRHLRPHEIVGQWLRVRAELPARPFTNIVFMGMGEPLHNVAYVIDAISIFTHDYGLQVPARRITVSTSGLVPGIEKLFARTSVRLALSVNGSTAAQRYKIMPVERAYPMAQIFELLKTRERGNHHDVMFEYVLLAGVNDSDDDARALVASLGDTPGRINLIPYNGHPGSEYQRPSRERVFAFHKIVRAAGRNVFIRESKGTDVLAACGQLHHERAAAPRESRIPNP
jgi:23S rRNA (adenine2503-C2)-methyltransferase